MPKNTPPPTLGGLGDLFYETDYYNEFFISPGSLLAEELRQWMARSGLFEHVVGSPRAVEPNYILEGEVTALNGDYSLRATRRLQSQYDRK